MQRLLDNDFPQRPRGLVVQRDKTQVNKSAEKSAFQFVVAPRNRWGKEKELAVFPGFLIRGHAKKYAPYVNGRKGRTICGLVGSERVTEHFSTIALHRAGRGGTLLKSTN